MGVTLRANDAESLHRLRAGLLNSGDAMAIDTNPFSYKKVRAAPDCGAPLGSMRQQRHPCRDLSRLIEGLPLLLRSQTVNNRRRKIPESEYQDGPDGLK